MGGGNLENDGTAVISNASMIRVRCSIQFAVRPIKTVEAFYVPANISDRDAIVKLLVITYLSIRYWI
jgi:hypothetical protein